MNAGKANDCCGAGLDVRPKSTFGPWAWTGFALLLLLVARTALLDFGRAQPGPDFPTVWRWSAAFVGGGNPYRGINPYLPSALLLTAPLGLFPIAVAWYVWKVTLWLLQLGCLVTGYRYLKQRLDRDKAFVACLSIVLLDGFSFRVGNPGVPAAMLTYLAVVLVLMPRPTLAGVALGVAVSVKYNLSLPFLFILALARKWRTAGVAVVLVCVLNAAALIALAARGIALEEVAASLTRGVRVVGGLDDSGFERWFAAWNPNRFQLLSFSVALNDLGMSSSSANAVCYGLLLLAIAVVAWVLVARPGCDRDLRLLGCVSAIAPLLLTCTYNRFYNTAILGITAILAWELLRRGNRRLALVVFALLTPFLIPISNTIQQHSMGAGVMKRLLESPWWRFCIAPHHMYALMVLGWVLLVWVLRSDRAGCRERQ
ncbi:MAG: DUF2029 domain-containing protein [Thermoguttaceae bacterium]|jgi:hypothetical protein|nr:DUF2029 domain-containing protein [Thermoguttaceae bacterium]